MPPKKTAPADQDPRSPEEISRLAQNVMRKMLATPPKPHGTKQTGKKRVKN
jgi:hypothetical protein